MCRSAINSSGWPRQASVQPPGAGSAEGCLGCSPASGWHGCRCCWRWISACAAIFMLWRGWGLAGGPPAVGRGRRQCAVAVVWLARAPSEARAAKHQAAAATAAPAMGATTRRGARQSRKATENSASGLRLRLRTSRIEQTRRQMHRRWRRPSRHHCACSSTPTPEPRSWGHPHSSPRAMQRLADMGSDSSAPQPRPQQQATRVAVYPGPHPTSSRRSSYYRPCLRHCPARPREHPHCCRSGRQLPQVRSQPAPPGRAVPTKESGAGAEHPHGRRGRQRD